MRTHRIKTTHKTQCIKVEFEMLHSLDCYNLRCFIQQQDLWIANESTCYNNTLLLTAYEIILFYYYVYLYMWNTATNKATTYHNATATDLTWQQCASFANSRFIAVRQFHDEIMSVGTKTTTTKSVRKNDYLYETWTKIVTIYRLQAAMTSSLVTDWPGAAPNKLLKHRKQEIEFRNLSWRKKKEQFQSYYLTIMRFYMLS